MKPKKEPAMMRADRREFAAVRVDSMWQGPAARMGFGG